jgi:hypothetical protein
LIAGWAFLLVIDYVDRPIGRYFDLIREKGLIFKLAFFAA